MLIEHKSLRILTDPGVFTTEQDSLTAIDVVLITHEHADHFSAASVKKIFSNNPGARLFTIPSVKALLEKEGLRCELLQDGESVTIEGVLFEGCGKEHAAFHSSIPAIPNTGYRIAEKFFFPGDSFSDPKKPVEILALPCGGPWMKISEAVDFALHLKPKVVFPVHDAIYKDPSFAYRVPTLVLEQHGIKFEPIDGKGMVYFD